MAQRRAVLPLSSIYFRAGSARGRDLFPPQLNSEQKRSLDLASRQPPLSSDNKKNALSQPLSLISSLSLAHFRPFFFPPPFFACGAGGAGAACGTDGRAAESSASSTLPAP